MVLKQIFEHQFGGRLGAADDAGDAGTGVGARADEIEIVDHIIAVVRTEPGALSKQRFEAEGAADMGVEIGGEICRGVMEADDDLVVNVGNVHPLSDFINDPFFETRPFDRPVDRQFAEIADRSERIEGGVAGGRHAGIGDGRVVQIEREIFRQDAIVIDVLDQPLIARAEDDAVVGDVGVIALQPEMDDEQRGREAFARQRFRRLFAA